VKSFPNHLVEEGYRKCTKYSLADGKLTIQASIQAVTSNVLPITGKHGLSENQINIASDGLVKYWLSLYIRFYESGPRRPGNTKEWDTQFWSGGLPELGKRR